MSNKNIMRKQETWPFEYDADVLVLDHEGKPQDIHKLKTISGFHYDKGLCHYVMHLSVHDHIGDYLYSVNVSASKVMLRSDYKEQPESDESGYHFGQEIVSKEYAKMHTHEIWLYVGLMPGYKARVVFCKYVMENGRFIETSYDGIKDVEAAKKG